MIFTLTPNPSVDRTITLSALTHGAVNRAEASRVDPGGKGVNVSRALWANGASTLAVLPLGGAEGDMMARLLDEVGLAYIAVPVEGAVRMNVAVVEPDGTTTKVNEPGPLLRPEDGHRLLERVCATVREGDWVLGCGSLAPGLPSDFFAQLITAARGAGARVAIDSSGAPMARALGAAPDLIKPNHEELEEIAGRRLDTVGEVLDAARDLVVGGIATVVVSLGADGAVIVNADSHVWACSAIDQPVSTVGAGDCLLAGVLSALADSADPSQALTTGVRWGSAAVTLPGSRVPTAADLARVRVWINDASDLSRPVRRD